MTIPDGKNLMEVALKLGVSVQMWKFVSGLKGLIACVNGKYYIAINEALTDAGKDIVLAHELGHYMAKNLYAWQAPRKIIEQAEMDADRLAIELLKKVVGVEITLDYIQAIRTRGPGTVL